MKSAFCLTKSTIKYLEIEFNCSRRFKSRFSLKMSSGSVSLRSRPRKRKAEDDFVYDGFPKDAIVPMEEDLEPSFVSAEESKVEQDLTLVSEENSGRKRSRARPWAEDPNVIPFTLLRASGAVADWDDLLQDLNHISWICPVDFFKHAPLASKWTEFAKVGRKIELPHPQSVGERPVYAVATVVAFAGYKALVKFEKIGTGSPFTTWISYCSSLLKPVGFSIINGHPIFPVEGIGLGAAGLDMTQMGKQFIGHLVNLKDYAIANSVAKNHYNAVLEELNCCEDIQLNQILEVMDFEKPIQNRLATVISILGDRIHVRYLDAAENEPESYVVLNRRSERLHPLGWSHMVKQQIKKYEMLEVQFSTLSRKHFPKYPADLEIKAGMVFEACHPIFPGLIVAARVTKRLNYGHFEANLEANRGDVHTQFVFHITSDYILPCGFAASHNIPLETPFGEDPENFCWNTYCRQLGVVPLQLSKLPPRPVHKFVRGCKLEAIDFTQSFYLGPATVLNVADHLLYLHFDGWPKTEQYLQWTSAFSPDIYPAGWAEMTGHSFQSHPQPPKSEDSYFILRK